MTAEAWIGLGGIVVAVVVATVQILWGPVRRKPSPTSEVEQTPAAGASSSDTKTEEARAPGIASSRATGVLSSGRLRCGVIYHPPLAGWTFADGIQEFRGLYVDYARMVCSSAGLELQLEDVGWSELPTSFTLKQLDLVLSVFETTDRLAYADFVAAFHRIGLSAVARKGVVLPENIGDIVCGDYRIAVSVGEASESLVLRDLKVPRRRVVRVDSYELDDVFSPLVSEKADLSVSDSWTCAGYVDTHSDLVHLFSEDELYLCKNSIMVPKGDPEYAQWVDDIFNAVRSRDDARELEVAALEQTGGWVRKFR